MSSLLPSEDASLNSVNDFGLGPYDGASYETSLKGENVERLEPSGDTLPDGGPGDDEPLEYYLSYPQETAVNNKHSADMLPGDIDRPPRGRNPNEDLIIDQTPSGFFDPDITDDGEPVSDPGDHSHLPVGGLPVARADYYDNTVLGAESMDDIWTDTVTNTYSEKEDEVSDDSLPGVTKNEVSIDDLLGAFGNSWSGIIEEDLSGPNGFPSTDFSENVDYPKSNDDTIGQLVASVDTSISFKKSGGKMNRIATDTELVESLTKDFLKQFGKKNLVRRHVLAFLQDRKLPQYLASDVVRCLKHNHQIVIPDVMDTFPLAKIASENSLDSKKFIESTIRSLITFRNANNVSDETRVSLTICEARLASVLVDLELLEVSNA